MAMEMAMEMACLDLASTTPWSRHWREMQMENLEMQMEMQMEIPWVSVSKRHFSICFAFPLFHLLFHFRFHFHFHMGPKHPVVTPCRRWIDCVTEAEANDVPFFSGGDFFSLRQLFLSMVVALQKHN